MSRPLWLVSILCASMLGAIFGPALASAVINPAAPPDDTLVYVPVPPCKVFAGVQLDGADENDIETVDITEVPAGSQNADPCATTAAPSTAVAASLNLIAQSVTARGNLQIGPGGGNTESVVNFVNTVDMNNSTELTVELDALGQVSLQLGGSATNGLVNVATAKGVLLGYWIPGTSVYESFERTVVVSGAGTNIENGTALLNAVTAVNAQGATTIDPWLIRLEPGTFDLGASTVFLGDGVLLEGAGSGFVVGSQIMATGTVIQTTGDTSVSDVLATSSGGIGLRVTSGSQARVQNVNMRGSIGIRVLSSGNLSGSEITAFGDGGDGLNISGTVVISDVYVGLTNGDAVIDHLGGLLELTNARVQAFGTNSSGIFTNPGLQTELRYVTIDVPGAGDAIDGDSADICEAVHLRQAGVATFIGAGACPAT